MKNDRMYLEHIREAVEKCLRYTRDLSFEDFVHDDMRTDAVVRQLEIIGEAARQLSNEFCDDHPQIPIRDMVDMRNVLIHDYAGVNLSIVWETCKKDLPQLCDQIHSLLE